MQKRLIDTNGLGLIIINKSTIYYTNQTGGYTCHHPEQEGTFVPLGDHTLAKLLYIYFTGPKHKGWCNHIDSEDADYLDRLFKKHEMDFIVLRDALKSSEEAWIYVIMTKDTKSYQKGELAILVWENSD